MQWIRSLFFSAGMILSLLVYVPLLMLTAPLSSNTRYRFISAWSGWILWWLKVTCGLTYRVRGNPDVGSKPGIVMCRHESAWETFAVQKLFPPQVWVLKKELLYIPLFGWGLALASPIAIDRKAKSRALDQVGRQGRDRLAMGRWIVIFPEGTRMPPCKVGKFASSGSLLAKKTGSHVVPVAHNAGQFWGKGKFLKKPGVIDVVVGESIDTSEMTAREITAAVENWMREQMAQMPGCDEKSV